MGGSVSQNVLDRVIGQPVTVINEVAFTAKCYLACLGGRLGPGACEATPAVGPQERNSRQS